MDWIADRRMVRIVGAGDLGERLALLTTPGPASSNNIKGGVRGNG